MTGRGLYIVKTQPFVTAEAEREREREKERCFKISGRPLGGRKLGGPLQLPASS